jgi:hypothetical protein
VVRRSKGITVGQTRVTENNLHWGSCTGRSAARRASLSSAKARAWRVEKRKEVEASVPARIKSSGLVARTSISTLQKSVGDNGSRISSANALQKGRSGRVNGGLARCEGRWVKPAENAPRERKSRVGLTAKDGRGPAQGPGWRESVIQRFAHRQKRCAGRGTGAVMATGSYEGSLPIEGIPDHREASAFTRRRGWWSWRSPHPPTRLTTPKAESNGQIAAHAKVCEA